MATQHYCDKAKGWKDGTVTGCPDHGFNGKKQHVFKSARTKRGLDAAGGEKGTARDEGYWHAELDHSPSTKEYNPT